MLQLSLDKQLEKPIKIDMSKGDDIDAIIANGISWGRGGASNRKDDDSKAKTNKKRNCLIIDLKF